MPLKNQHTEFASLILSDSEARARFSRKCTIIEVACTLLATLAAFLAVWGLTTDVQVLKGALHSNVVGSMAVLVFAALMAIAAGAGIQKRFIAFAEILNQHKQ